MPRWMPSPPWSTAGIAAEEPGSAMDKPDPRQVALFRSLTFDGFRKLANDPSLSPYEKIGFPDSFRAGREADIHRDILQKLPAMAASSTRILDIGCGCSDLP